MRKLLYAPIVHHILKDYSEEMIEAFRERGCPIEEVCSYAENNMKKIREKLEGRKIDKLYLDSFPWSGEEGRDIIMENRHKYVSEPALDVIDRGAELVGVENIYLSEECTIYAKMHTVEKDPVRKEVIKQKLIELVAKRDAWVADEIDTDLEEGETGLLMIGTGHITYELLKAFDDMEIEFILDPEEVRKKVFEIDPELI